MSKRKRPSQRVRVSAQHPPFPRRAELWMALGLTTLAPGPALAQVNFSGPTSFATGDGPGSVAVSDLNGDGKLDLVANSLSGNVSVLLGDGSGGFGAATNFDAGFGSPFSGSGPFSVAVGDLDGDRNRDLAVANGFFDSVSVLLGDGSGGFGVATNFATGNAPFSVAVGDLNGDGKLDLAIANAGFNEVSVLHYAAAGGQL
jgi:hypothetical protein